MKSRKGLAERLFDRGARVVGQVAGAVLSDARGQEAVARAVGLAQRGLRFFESAQERALHAAGLAARPDYNDLRKQVARLKRKARELGEQLEAAAPAPRGRNGASRSADLEGGDGDDDAAEDLVDVDTP
jgi:hypothetical protein